MEKEAFCLTVFVVVVESMVLQSLGRQRLVVGLEEEIHLAGSGIGKKIGREGVCASRDPAKSNREIYGYLQKVWMQCEYQLVGNFKKIQ